MSSCVSLLDYINHKRRCQIEANIPMRRLCNAAIDAGLYQG
jgi:hypothetical protein